MQLITSPSENRINDGPLKNPPPIDKEEQLKEKLSSPSFAWQDVKAYHQRLQSFHRISAKNNENDYNCLICLPVEISPIICSRFGWERSTMSIDSSSNNSNSNSNKDIILLSCQDQANCKAFTCIKYNPLLSNQSKKKLTEMYREMLATNHADGCSFQYDALSWLKEREENTTNSTNPSSRCIVPPFLIHLSKQYQMIQSCCDNSNDTSLVSQLIQAHSERLGKYCYNRNQKGVSVVQAPAFQCNSDIQDMMVISNETMERMLDIAKSSIPSSTSLFTSTESAVTSVNNILQDIISHLDKKQDEEEGLLSLIGEERQKNKDETTSLPLSALELAEELKNKLQDHYGDNEKSDDFREKEKSKYTSKGTLLLSIFGWRLMEGIDDTPSNVEQSILNRSSNKSIEKGTDTSTTNTTTTNSAATGISDDRAKDAEPINVPVYVKCDLCLNCCPLPKEFLQLEYSVQSEKSEKKAGSGSCSDSGEPSEPPQKKRRMVNNDCGNSLDESNVQNVSTRKQGGDQEDDENIEIISVNKPQSFMHKFDVINSHRYYCPLVCGFRQILDSGDDKNQTKMRGPEGTSDPCWEGIWTQLLQSTRKYGVSDGNEIGSQTL